MGSDKDCRLASENAVFRCKRLLHTTSLEPKSSLEGGWEGDDFQCEVGWKTRWRETTASDESVPVKPEEEAVFSPCRQDKRSTTVSETLTLEHPAHVPIVTMPIECG